MKLNNIHAFLSHISVYIYGDIYSINGRGLSTKSAGELIEESYRSGNLAGTVALLNGYFVCIIVDHNNKKLILLNDRYGLKPLYLWTEHSSIKAYTRWFLPHYWTFFKDDLLIIISFGQSFTVLSIDIIMSSPVIESGNLGD